MPRAAATFALGLALVLCGGLFDAEPLFVPGAAFMALAAAAVAWVRLAARGATVTRTISATRVVEDEPLSVRLDAAAGRLPFPGGVVEEPLLGGAPAGLPPGQRAARIEVQARFARRGRRTLPAPRLVVRDPLGLASRAAGGGEAAEVLVLPRLSPVTVEGGGDAQAAGRARALLAGAAEVDLDGLRPYRPGAPASRIHWAALARGAGLLERRLRPEGDGRPLVVLDARAPATPEDLDAAVRAAASLVVALAGAGGCSALLPGDRRATRIDPELGAWPALHARLAVVAAAAAPPALSGAAAAAGTVIYVAARAGSVPRGLAAIGGHRLLVAPGALGNRPPAVSVAGCHGYVLDARTPTVDAPATARLASLAALGLFGILHWAQMVQPAPSPRAAGLLAVALAAAGAAEALRGRRLAAPGVAGAALAGAAGVMLVAGIPVRLLVPAGLGELADGLRQGAEVLPDVRVPYEGSDVWVSWVIMAGGGLLLLAAGLLGTVRLPGARIAAAALLAVVYGVPAVQFQAQAQIGRGAVFTLLLAAYLWLERVPRRAAPTAAGLVAAAVAVGALAAPVLDRDRPWIDYESLASSLAPGRGVTFNFEHRYGPIDWPRDGRQLLRIRARSPLYWKAENLDEFDGLRWRRRGASGALPDPAAELPPEFERHPAWRQRLTVTLRGLESESLITAGTTLAIVRPPSGSEDSWQPLPQRFSLRKPLKRGDSYQVEVYAPRPRPSQLQRAGTVYPGTLANNLTLEIPRGSAPPNAVGDTRPPLYYRVDRVEFPAYGSGGPPLTSGFGTPSPAEDFVAASPYARTWALARRLGAASVTPYDYVRRVESYLGRGFAYSEDPPERAVPLESFLFDDKRGYCQQFSGAMAVLLRMGGIPSRVVGGFSPGSLSTGRKEWVVRDTDAHSWVEAFFPGYGWVTFDPTPAASPARLQLSLGDRTSWAAGGAALTGPGDRPQSRRVPAPAAGAGGRDRGGVPWPWIALVLAAAAGAALAARALVRRHRVAGSGADPWFDELRRALRRSGRDPDAPVTLRTLERGLRSPGAVAYVRAVRSRRYAAGGSGPTQADRRALRAELGGPGLAGRLRGLWAVPPGRPGGV
jgi:protein-glutamine gamma-glutamyltransferase